MKVFLRWFLPERADEAMADARELLARRTARGQLVRARVRWLIDLGSLVVLGLVQRAHEATQLPRAVTSGLGADLRYATRMLRKTPSFSIAAILILALGIGANTGVFTLVNAMLLAPIPTDDPLVVGVYSRDTARADEYRSFSYSDYQHIREAGPPFEEVMAYTLALAGLTEGDDTRRVSVVIATANFFSVLRTPLALGRAFTADEERPGADLRVVIASHQYWHRQARAATDLGGTVRLNGNEFTVVGVAPPGFTGTMAGLAPDFWAPTGAYERLADDLLRQGRTEPLGNPTTRSLMLVGRLAAGLTADEAEPLLSTVSSRLVAADPAANATYSLAVHRLPRLAISTEPHTDASAVAVSALLMGSASLVLLLACLNLANMLLARGSARRREMAVRVAVGAGRLRVARQLLVECLMLALVGGAAGLLLAMSATELLAASAHAALPLSIAIDSAPDARVLLATLTFSLVSTVAAGLGPAWRASRADLVTDLKDQPAQPRSLGRLSVRNALVVAQIAVCLALLVAAGLFVRGAFATARADPGFAAHRGAILGVDPGLAGYDEARSRATLSELMERLRSLPGVERASFASQVPFGEERFGRPVLAATAPDDAPATSASYTVVGGDYFETLGIPLLRGRGFTIADESQRGPLRAVIDQALATRLFGDVDPVGQEIRDARDANRRSMQVIGVAGPIRDGIDDLEPTPHLYVPYGQTFASGQYVHLRLRDGILPSEYLDYVRRVVVDVDPQLPVLRLKTLEQFFSGTLQVWAVVSAARVFVLFGTVALLLAVVGVYGVKLYVVSLRTREIAVRLALGATPGGVVWMIVREGIALTGAGLILGLFAAWGTARVLSAIMFGVRPTDPIVFGVAVGVLATAALVASYLPARRATQLEPTAALRAD
jgi:predicted permease